MDTRSRFNPYLPQFGCILLLLAVMSLCIIPLVMVDAARDALQKLHLSGPLATLVLIGIFVGGLINLPLYRVNRGEDQPLPQNWDALRIGGRWSWVPMERSSVQTIVAVNVGGCLIPATLAIYLATHLWRAGPQPQLALVVATLVNIYVCWRIARPIPGLGIAIPPFAPPLAAILLAWILLAGERYDAFRAPVAFVAGVSGPLIGADLLNLRKFERISAGVISIGGAGTFDGIVISGLVAAFFA
jgi:uncharacterized membrane protein